MKHAFLSLAMLSLLAVPVVHATAAPQAGQRTQPRSTQARPAAQTHVVNAEFVSYDAKAHIMTIKDEKGQTSKAPLQGGALREMTQLHLKSGDHLTLTCRDNAKGEHQAITDVKLATPKA
jgi:hypothetical protein